MSAIRRSRYILFAWEGQSKILWKDEYSACAWWFTYNTTYQTLEGEYNRGCGFSQDPMSRPFFCSLASNIETQLYEWKVIVINDNTWIDGGGDEAQENEWFRVSFHGALCDEQRLNPSNHRQQELLTSRIRTVVQMPSTWKSDRWLLPYLSCTSDMFLSSIPGMKTAAHNDGAESGAPMRRWMASEHDSAIIRDVFIKIGLERTCRK